MQKKIYLIPGTMCNELLWQELHKYLGNTFTLIYLDIPINQDFEQLVEHYLSVFEQDIKSNQMINLVGFSLGGYIAAYFACKYPRLVNKLFIIANTPSSLPMTEIHQRTNIVNYVNQNGYKGMSRNRICSMLDSSKQNDKIINIISTMDLALGAKYLISQYRNTTQRFDLLEKIIALNSKVVFYFSEEDSLIDKEWLLKLNRTKKNNKNIVIQSTAGAGHMLPLEKPEELADLIIKWI